MDVSFQQDDFLGGEWSPYAQGRYKHPKYSTALNVCRNGYPLEEGAWTRRSGTGFAATTRDGADGRLIEFDFNEPTPYKMEFTDGHLRLFSGRSLVFTNDATSLISFTPDGSQNALMTVAFGTSWVAGDQIQFLFESFVLPNCAILLNRQFVLIGTSPQFTLADPITGDVVTYASLNYAPGATIQVARVLDIPTPWTSTNWALDTIRSVQTGDLPNGPLTGLTFLFRGNVSPQALLCTAAPAAPNFATFTLNPADFLDGPYLDAIPGLYGTPSGSATVGPVIIPLWNNTTAYSKGNVVEYGGYNFIATTVVPAGGLPPQPGADGFHFWQVTPAGVWSNTVNYAGGAQVTESTTVGSVTTTNTYTSIIAHNKGNDPSTDAGVHWIAYNTQTVDGSASGLGPGSIQFDIAYQTYSATVSYNFGDTVTRGGTLYTSLVDGNYDNTPGASTFWEVAEGVPNLNGGQGFVSTDVGRNIRFYSEPPVWNSGTAYTVGEYVQYPQGQQQYWQAATANTGQVPGSTIVTTTIYWVPATGATVAAWAWGRITAVNSMTEVIVSLIGSNANNLVQGAGDTLLYADTVYTWVIGAYSDTTGWPTCGCYHEGRLYMGGAVPNRWDASATDDINGSRINMAPTAIDGTVADANGISYVFNASEINQITWMKSMAGGIMCGTLPGEWLISSTANNEPITPISVQAHRVTKNGCGNIEPVEAPLATIFVQKFLQKVLEWLPDVWTGRYRAPNMSVFAKHLFASGAAEIRYQEELIPLLWARMNDGSLAGCTYRRISQFVSGEQDLSAEAALTGWHRHDLGSGRVVQSIVVGVNEGGTLDTLALVTNQTNTQDIDYNVRHVEILADVFNENETLQQAWYVDDAISPYMLISTEGVTCYGLWHLNGKTVTAWIGGLDCGDFTVDNGQIFVPWGSAGPPPAEAGLFTQDYLESLNGVASAATTELSSVTVTPAGDNISPGTVQWYGGTSPGSIESAAALPDWQNDIVYFGGAPTVYALAAYTISDGDLIAGATNAEIFTGDYAGYEVGAIAFGAAGQIVTATNPGGGGNNIATIDATTLGLLAVGPNGGIGGALAVTEMIALVGPDGDNYILQTGSGGFTDGAIGVFNLTTNVWSGSQTITNVHTPHLCLAGKSLAWCVGGVQQWDTNAASMNIYPVLFGTDEFQLGTPVNVAASAFGVKYNLMALAAPVVDQTDGNLLLTGDLIKIAGGSDGFIAKVDPYTGAVLWVTVLPSGNTAFGDQTWSNSRVTGGIVSFYVGDIACVVNTTNGTLVQYTGSAFGNEGGGQVSDSVTGQIICFANFNGGSATIRIAGINGTPSAFNFEWATAKLGTLFIGAQTVQTTYQVPGLVGFTFTSQGQCLRATLPQDAGTATGPAGGKTRRSHMFAVLLANSQGLQVGVDFTEMYPAEYREPDQTAYPPTELWNGMLWGDLEAGYDFDDMLAWQITRPYPSTVASISAFRHGADR